MKLKSFKFIFSIVFPLFLFNNMYPQYFKRNIILKNNVLEARCYEIKKDGKELRTIYYFNDSGLVEKEIHFSIYVDSVVAINPDTGFISIYKYDSLNREISEIRTFRDRKDTLETEYVNKNTVKITAICFGSTTFHIEKKRTRKHLTITRVYREGHFESRTRIRKYARKIIIHNSGSLRNWKAKKKSKMYKSRMWRNVISLDSLGRDIKIYNTYRKFFLSQYYSNVTIQYNGDLIEKKDEYYKKTQDHHYVYEYKKGIKLKKQ